jgi:hypothetical protein
MTHSPVSRRAFFGRMLSGCGFGIALKETVQPEKAWIVVALGWEYNDEFAYSEGEYLQPSVFYDKP